MTDPNFSAIRARLRYETLDDFIDGYSRFISNGGMFIPMTPAKLKPVGTTIRFQFLLQDGTSAMLGEGVVRQIQGADSDDNSPVGMLVKFTKLSRESKEVVDRVVSLKSNETSGLAPDSEELRAATPEANEAAPPPQEPAHEAIPAADEAQTRDGSEPHTTEFEADQEEAGLDDMFLPADDEESEAAEEPEPAPEPNFAEVGASGSDVFSEADGAADDEDPPEEPQLDEAPSDAVVAEAAETDDAGPGPKELGRTEAGLQIMAFDDVSDDEMADFADFEFGGDEDDVDQMFDGIFGGGGGDDDGGGLFGGGGDGDGDFFGGGDDDGGDFFGDGDADGLVGDSINDGGEPLGETEQSPGTVELDTQDVVEEEPIALDEEFELEEEVEEDDEPVDETFDLDEVVDETFDTEQSFELEEESAGPIDEQPVEEEPVDETFDLDEVVDEDDAELLEEESVDETFDLEEEVDLEEESEPEEEVDLEEESEPEDEFELDEDIDLEEEDDEEEIDLDEESIEELDDAELILEESEGELEPPAAAEGLAEESSAPSEELLSALGSLDDDDEGELSLSIGAGAAEEEAEPEPEDDDEEDSLESLLAAAQQDIDAKREAEEADDQGDILDDLLGGDDMPPPPPNEPVFDISDNEKKKKKGGFISKLFGKD